MIHGDLKGVRPRQVEASSSLSLSIKANILVDQAGHARVADFGLLTLISDSTNGLSTNISAQGGGTSRWMSPGLINPQRFKLDKSRPTKPSDCYALGMAIYETIGGHLPFHKEQTPTVLTKVQDGHRPPRESCFTDSLWKMLEECWKPQPGDRPSIEDVLRRLCLETELPLSNVEMEEDGDDSDSFDDTFCKFPRFIPSAEAHGSCSRVGAEVSLVYLQASGSSQDSDATWSNHSVPRNQNGGGGRNA